MKKILQNPVTLLVSVALGILVGVFARGLTPFLDPINNVYISLLQVCSLPIIICTVTINIGKIFKKEFRSVLSKWIVSSFIVMILAAVVGLLVSVSMTKFLTASSDQVKASLSKSSDSNREHVIIDSFLELKAYDDNDISNENEFSLMKFLQDIIPENVFYSLSNNNIIQVVIFFVIFGIMLDFIEKRFSKQIIDLFEGINDALYKFMNVLLLFLPASVFIMMASLFSDSNMLNIFGSIVNFIIVNYIAIILYIVISFVIITICVKCSIKQHLNAIKRTFFVAIATSNRLTSVTVAIEDSVKKMNLDESSVSAFLPISSILFPNGKILTTVPLAIYALTVYGTSRSLSALAIIIIYSVLYAICICEVSNIAAASLLTILFAPLGLPTDLMSIILITAVKLYGGLSTFVDVYSNLAVLALISPKKKLKNGNITEVVVSDVS